MDTVEFEKEDEHKIVTDKQEQILDAIAHGIDQTTKLEIRTGELASLREYMTSPEYPNLTKDEEAFFHSVMWEGFNAQQELLSSNGNLSPQQYESLASRIEDGRMSFDILFLSVQGLGWLIAKRYHSVITEDMVQQANIAIERAIKSFNPQKGKLSTHVTWEIRSELDKYYRILVSQIPLPAQLFSRVKKLELVTQQLGITLGRMPTDEELAKEMNLSVKIIRKVQKDSIEIESMDEPLSTSSTKTLADIIEDPNPTPEDQFIKRQTSLDLIQALEQLGKDDFELVSNRYGITLKDNKIEYGQPTSAKELSEITGVNPSTIAYRTKRAVNRLKRICNSF